MPPSIKDWARNISEPYKSWMKANSRFLSEMRYRLLRFVSPRELPKNEDGKVYLHLGCGPQDDPRYINVDAFPSPNVHYVQTVGEMRQFASNTVDMVYASHVLEHISHQYTLDTLKEWRRIVKPGGVLRISVPDFDKLLYIYESEGQTIESILPLLMGVQDTEVSAHRAVFNEKFLTELLQKTGFKSVNEWDPEQSDLYTFDDFASAYVVRGEKEENQREYPISLNLEAVK